MTGLALVLARISRDRGGQLAGCDDAEWHIACRTVGDERTAVWCADHGQRRNSDMRAALGAAGNMDCLPVLDVRSGSVRNHRREGARRDMRRSANRGTSTSHDPSLRIVGASNKAEFPGGGDK